VSALDKYRPIVGDGAVEELYLLGERLRGRTVQHINSTRVGGGVAEILTNLVPLFREVGVDACWDVISGTNEFFEVTKKFHNALHGQREDITKEMLLLFRENGRRNLETMPLRGDITVVHDPQPVMMIRNKQQTAGPWIWRCHIDIARADPRVFSFLRQFISEYDGLIFSSPLFSKRFSQRQFLISPSIDPLSDKNRDLEEIEIGAVLDRYGIDRKRPIVLQVSRYDYLKDPVGVIEAFRLVRKYNDCQLVLAGNRAADDPESDRVLAEVREKAGKDPDIHILLVPPENNDIDINALQRSATVVVQKSIREGFGLVVSEALWKGRPMVASAVGGIPLQVEHGRTGLLCRSVEGAALQIKQLLNNPDYARKLGENGREHVRQHFLLTRHLRDYLLLLLALPHGEDIINL